MPERSILPRQVSKITRHGAMTVVWSEDKERVLLLRREIFILWELPGGGIERGEDGAQAAVRETREETGYQIVIDRPVGIYLHPSVYGGGDQRTQVFCGHVVGGTPRRWSMEITGLRWYRLDELPRGLQPLHRQMIADALADSPEPFSRRIEFPLWQLYPARVAFLSMSLFHKTISRLRRLI